MWERPERAGGARRLLGDIDLGIHGGVEGIAADDLVNVRGRYLAGLDEGIEALDAQGGASEAEVGISRAGEPKGNRKPLHFCCLIRELAANRESPDSPRTIFLDFSGSSLGTLLYTKPLSIVVTVRRYDME